MLCFLHCTLTCLVSDPVYFLCHCIFYRSYWSLRCKSSKSIDSINALNTFQCLVISSNLFAGQFICLFSWSFRMSLCALFFVQWNMRRSVVWSPLPQINFASFRRLKRWSYVLRMYELCMCVCVCIYVCICMHVCVCIYRCLYVCMYVCMYACMYVAKYVCMYIYECMYVCM